MKSTSQISCDVCQDLIPLVLDHVASKDSTLLVTEHVASCDSCRQILSQGDLESSIVTNDQQIMKKIKKSIYISMFFLLIFGGLFGLALSNSNNIFYNFMIMPIVGSLSYIIFKKKWYFPFVTLGIIAFVWIIVSTSIADGYDSSLFIYSFYITGNYMVFQLLGVLIAWLLHYAFRKGEESSKL